MYPPVRNSTQGKCAKSHKLVKLGMLPELVPRVVAMHPPVMGKGVHTIYIRDASSTTSCTPMRRLKGNVDFQSRLKRCKAHTVPGSSTDPLPAW